MRSFAHILLVACLAVRLAPAQEYTFRSYVRGLGNLSVNALDEDDQGFIWVGTESGLFRFDGVNFTRFGRESGLPGGFILGIDHDILGRLWVATHDGLAYRGGDGKFQAVTYHNRPLRLTQNPLLAMTSSGRVIVMSPDGLVSLGLSSGGLSSGQAEWYPVLPAGNAFASDPKSIKSLRVRRDGSVLFGCGTGICQLNSGSVSVWGPENGLPKDKWGRIIECSNGDVWARSLSHAVRLRAGASRFEIIDLPQGAASTTRLPLVEDSAGRILAGLSTGVARFEEGKWSVIDERNGFVDGTVRALLIDRENQPWIGFAGNGIVNWLGYDRWEQWTQRQGLSTNDNWSLLRDSRGRLWAGQRHGLDVMEPGSKIFRLWQPESAAAAATVIRSMAETRDGFLWMAASEAGTAGLLLQVDVKTLRVVSQTAVDGIESMFVDSEDRVWLATDKGLLVAARPAAKSAAAHEPLLSEGKRGEGKRGEGKRGEGKRQRRTWSAVSDHFRYSGFLEVRQSPDGDIYALTDSALFRQSPAGWKEVDVSKGGLGHEMSTMAFSGDGWLWIGSVGSGATRFKISNGRAVASEHLKLSSNQIVFLGADDRGWMWVGQDDGVEVFDGVSFHSYNLDNGLIWNDCNLDAFTLDRDGSVWLGTSGGISHFVGERLPIDVPSKPILASIQYGSHSLAKPFAEIRAQHDPLILNIASMSFGEQGNLVYRYRMVGLEDNWTESQTPEVRYPNLSPGTYRFEVAAVNVNSHRVSPLETFGMRIIPPWYLTRVFAFVLLLLAVGVARLVWEWRVRILVARQRDLERLVLDRTEELNRRLEQKKVLQAEAERANQAKSNFLAMMSHEIRTPMNGVVGMTTLLESTDLSPTQADYVRTIQESSTALLSIINDILDFSKIEADKLNLESIDFRLLTCVREVLGVIRHSAARKGIALNSDLDPTLPDVFVGDPVRIKQVLLNLLSNAVKFTEEGAVELRVYRGETIGSDRAQIIFEVKDTGIGISPETQAQLFQSFTQAETSTTRKYGGTGLGLVICKRLVEMIGGYISVESQIGRGSTFRVALNLKLSTTQIQETPLPEAAAKRLAPAFSEKRILVAEDNLINQKVALRLLNLLGYRADVAENGAEVLRLLGKDHYDAILMDMHMPVMDGLEATMAIRNLEGALSRIPIIAVTANAIQGERQKCLAAGMNDYITKPIEKDKFAAALEYWTSQKRNDTLLSA